MVDPLTPASKFNLTLLQMIAVMLFIGGVGYSVGRVSAQLEAHEELPGHAAVVAKVETLSETMARVAAVLEVMQAIAQTQQQRQPAP